jgi:hypothetical protein
MLALGGEGGKREQDDEQRHEHLKRDRGRQFGEMSRARRLARCVGECVAPVRLEIDRQPDEAVDAVVESGQPVERPEERDPFVRRDVRVRGGLVQPLLALRHLGFVPRLRALPVEMHARGGRNRQREQ